MTKKSICDIEGVMEKEKLIEILKGILGEDVDLSFLLQLENNQLETLVACIREKVDKV